MLTSFFGKSNPLNFLILGIFIFMGYSITVFKGDLVAFKIENILTHLVVITISIFTMLLVDFIIRKNALTKTNTYGILLFSCFLLMLPAISSESNVLFSNLFILLALRRILSLKSERNNEKKILDATFWISLASFFYFYSLLLFIVLYIAIIRSKHTNYKHLLIPPIGFLAVFVLFTTYNYLAFDSFEWFYTWKPISNYDFSIYMTKRLLVPSSILLSILFLFGGIRLIRFSSIPKKERANVYLLFIVALTTLGIAVLSPQKSGVELLFITAPIAIIASNFIENNSSSWLNEGALWIIVFVPILFWIAY